MVPEGVVVGERLWASVASLGWTLSCCLPTARFSVGAVAVCRPPLPAIIGLCLGVSVVLVVALGGPREQQARRALGPAELCVRQ